MPKHLQTAKHEREMQGREKSLKLGNVEINDIYIM